MNCAIIIPIYKEDLKKYEQRSLERTLELFALENIFFVGPQKIKDFSFLKKISNDRFAIFEDEYFQNIAGYNRLLLSPFFYQYFLDKGYEWLQIAQLDSYFFHNDIQYFLTLDFDYFGAPWPNGQYITNAYIPQRLSKFLGRKVYVGNGGFSLRRLRTTIQLLKRHRLARYLWKKNEDGFFSYFGDRSRHFKACDYRTSIKYSIEEAPERLVEENMGKLPLGCHAFDKFGNEFYSQHIPQFNNLF